MGLSLSVNDGHTRSDGVGNGFVQTLHVRTNLVSPEHPPAEFVGSLEQEYAPPRFRVCGISRALKQANQRSNCQHATRKGWNT